MDVELDLVVTAKADPGMDPDARVAEPPSVAGISSAEPRGWVRLAPLDPHVLPVGQRFKLYQRITVRAARAADDARPETWVPDPATLRLHEWIDSDGASWRRRLDLLQAVTSPSLCEILRRQAADGTSLGVFRPAAIRALTVVPGPQGRPRLAYDLQCAEAACPGHVLPLIDGEIGDRWRQLEQRGVAFDAIRRELRSRYFDQVCGPDRDPRFICGATVEDPAAFRVVGVAWPSAAATAQVRSA